MVMIFTNNGYIISIMHGAKEGNVSEAEYLAIMDKLNQKPTPPSGYDYRLTVDLEWEIYELPKETDEYIEDEIDEATEADYQNELRRLGVEV
jgi:hypothetical protein